MDPTSAKVISDALITNANNGNLTRITLFENKNKYIELTKGGGMIFFQVKKKKNKKKKKKTKKKKNLMKKRFWR